MLEIDESEEYNLMEGYADWPLGLYACTCCGIRLIHLPGGLFKNCEPVDNSIWSEVAEPMDLGGLYRRIADL